MEGGYYLGKKDKVKQECDKDLVSDIRTIVGAYKICKQYGKEFDCPFCLRIVKPEERHFEDGLCRALNDRRTA